MKREDLKELGLTDEQIDKVMAENGRDIEKHKTLAETAKTEADNLKKQLTEANAAIDGFKAMNIDDIKKAADEWKVKAEQATTDAAAQITQLKFDHALDGALVSAKAKNAKAVRALLDISGLKLNEADGSILGLKEQLEKIQESNDYLFDADKPELKPITGMNNKSVLNDPLVAGMLRGAGLIQPDKEK